LQNLTKVVITSSPGLTGGSSGFKDFLDSPVKPGNDGKMTYSKISITDNTGRYGDLLALPHIVRKQQYLIKMEKRI